VTAIIPNIGATATAPYGISYNVLIYLRIDRLDVYVV